MSIGPGAPGLLVLIGLAASTVASADDVSGATRLICSSERATVCSIDQDCEIGPPRNWNIPQFMLVDFEREQLSTTPASGERRVTPFRLVERANGLIVIQGFERGRAFSVVIEETSGATSVAVARVGMTVTVSGVCTPQPK